MQRGVYIDLVKRGHFIRLAGKFIPSHRQHASIAAPEVFPETWREKAALVVESTLRQETTKPTPAGDVASLVLDLYPEPKALGKWAGKDDLGGKVAIIAIRLNPQVHLFIEPNGYYLQHQDNLYHCPLSPDQGAQLQKIAERTPNRYKGSKVGKEPSTGKLEANLHEQGFQFIAGVDEAGRGAWAGPIVGAVVVLGGDYVSPDGVMDSKGLDEETRNRLRDEIKLLPHGVGIVTAEEIDQIGIDPANLACFHRAVEELNRNYPEVRIEHILVDGKNLRADQFKFKAPFSCHVQGEQNSKAIAAASILAKVARDDIMQELGQAYPGYGLEEHKGYGTPQHIKSIRLLGVAPIHRQSYKPIKAYAAEKADPGVAQTSLFPDLS